MTVDEMPSHTHQMNRNSAESTTGNWPCVDHQGPDKWQGGNIKATGGDKAHNILQPSIAVYGWKRTA